MKIKSWTGETVEALLSVYDYDRNAGVFRWKAPAPNRVKAGTIAGSVGSEGYLRITVNKKRYAVHQIVWLLEHGFIPSTIDHINQNKLDNKIDNLRQATKSNNAINARMRPDNTSGFKGVSFSKKAGKWISQIKVDGKNKFIGHFSCAEFAAHAYNKAAIKYHGEFATPNPVGGVYV